jgi:hypothetical protein
MIFNLYEYDKSHAARGFHKTQKKAGIEKVFNSGLFYTLIQSRIHFLTNQTCQQCLYKTI